MAFTVNIVANTAEELKTQLLDMMHLLLGIKKLQPEDNLVRLPEETVEEIKPVITQDRMEENIKNAPAHEMPPVPTLEEVRAALKQLRDKKGAEAVKAILKEYGAGSLPELKEEDYLPVRDRALVEV